MNKGRFIEGLIAVGLALALVGCGANEVTPVATSTTSYAPAGGIEPQATYVAREYSVVTADQVKNLSESLKVSMDEEGNLIGLPETMTQDEKDDIKGYYLAIKDKFPSSQVSYSKDPEGSTWIFYAVKDGKLIHSIGSYGGGPEQYLDYPIQYELIDGKWVIAGDYQELEIPEGTLSVIWTGEGESRLPQFVADEVTDSEGNRYYKYFLNYKTYAEDENPWQEIDEVVKLLATQTPEATPVVTDLYSELTAEELAEKGLVGSGFELKTEYQGLPVDLTVLTSKAVLEQYGQTRGCMPNPEMAKYGTSAEDRMAEMIYLGHYVGYLEDQGWEEYDYSFDQYITDLKAGKDRSYLTWGVRPGEEDGQFKVDPLKPVEYAITNKPTDPDGNGRATALLNDNASRRGFQQLENGGVRIVEDIAGDNANFFNFCITSADQMVYALISLGADEGDLKGSTQLSIPDSWHTNTQNRIYTLGGDLQVYDDYQGSISWGIFTP